MKLSNKVRQSIFVTIVLLVIYVVREFEPKPLSAFTAIKDEYNLLCVSYENMNQNFTMKKYYADREKKLLAEKHILNVLNNLKQEEIIKILHGDLSSCNINLTKLNFLEELIVPLNNPMDGTIVETGGDNYYSIVTMSLNIEFNSKYEDMLKFIECLQNNQIDMAITNISTTFFEKNIVFVVMDISFYAVM